jgi:hypothetical protein
LPRFFEVNGLHDVEIKLLSGRNADVKAVLLDRVGNLLRVIVKDGAGALERGVLRGGKRNLLRGTGQRAAHILGLLKSADRLAGDEASVRGVLLGDFDIIVV